MSKIDRLGWAEGIAFRAYGLSVGVRVSKRGFKKRVRSTFPPGWKHASSPAVEHLYSLRMGSRDGSEKPRRFHLIYADTARIARSLDLDEVFQALESNIQVLVAVEAPSLLFVHAGVVAWKNRAIVLPGPSYSGKTRFVEALLRCGARYYSDEYAVIDKKGRVHPYLKPLWLRGIHGGRRRLRLQGNERHGPRRPALPIGSVILSRYREGARWRPRILSPGQAALALLSNTVVARYRPKFAMRTVQQALRRTVALAGVRGEADEAAASVLSRVGPNQGRRT